MIKLQRIRKRFQKEVNIYNAYFGEEEQIKKFELIDHEWAVTAGELTPTLKLKRNVLIVKHKHLIDKIYKSSTALG